MYFDDLFGEEDFSHLTTENHEYDSSIYQNPFFASEVNKMEKKVRFEKNTDNFSFKGKENLEVNTTQDKNLLVGMCSAMGFRKSMEDTHVYSLNYCHTPSWSSVLGVFDGHAGNLVAIMLQWFYLSVLFSEIKPLST